MSFYTRIATKVVKLIEKYGTDWTMEAMPAAASDSNKPWRGPTTTGTPIIVSPRGVVDSFSTKETDGERIRETDLKLLVAASDEALTDVDWDVDTTMFCDDLDTGVRYGCMVVEVVKPAATPVLYVLRLRLG